MKVKLTKEEKEIEESIDEFVPVTGKELEDIVRAIAARKKDMSLTLRVNSGDISRIKKMSKRMGIPYQTYISEIIHRVARAM